MSKILELYKEMAESGQRFIDEVFLADGYSGACPQLTIIDAGAYEGEFSFYCLNFAKKIYAFEPDPRPWHIMRGRIGSYELQDKIDLSNKALSGKSGTRVFHNTGFGGSRLLEPLDNPEDYTKEDQLTIDTISLADLFEEKHINQVDILKIDVEGGETEIFRAPEFPKLSKKIKLIIGEHLQAVDLDLKALGYKAREGGINTIYERP